MDTIAIIRGLDLVYSGIQAKLCAGIMTFGQQHIDDLLGTVITE